MTALTPAQVARRLNDHHTRTCAGFYPSTGGRAFLARSRKGKLEISYDFQTYHEIDHAAVTFRDHNGQPVRMK